MIRFDDELQVVEMEIVHDPPYIIDFAKVRLFSSPEFSEDTLAEYDREGRENFADNWPRVKSLLATLENDFTIFYLDPKPGNIVFPGQV